MSQYQLELQEKVNEALEVELKNARARYGDKFEDYGDMDMTFKREFFELKEEVEPIYENMGKALLTLCKKNQKELIFKAKEHAIKCAMEAIQVACVCTKWLEGDK